jgi:signal transduction histidine kinase
VRRRLIVAFVAVAAAAVLLLGIPLVVLLERTIRREAEVRLERVAATIAADLADELITEQIPTAELVASRLAQGESAVLELAGAQDIRIRPEPEGGVVSGSARGPQGSVVRVETSADAVNGRIRRAELVLGALGVAAVAAAAIAAIALSRRLARPLEEMAAAAQRLGAGDFSAAAPRSGLPEVDAIGEALDASAARIDRLVRAERAFSSNASHQLRTAVAGISLRLEALARTDDPRVRDEAGHALDQVLRLEDVLEELLALARTGRVGERRPFDLAALARLHVEDWAPRFAQAGRTLHTESEGVVGTIATVGAVGQVVDVLLANALRHGDGTATLAVANGDGRAQLTVSDEGPGVPAALVPGLFQPPPEPSVHGVGLPLARQLAAADGGALELVDAATATFRLSLPAA